MIFRYLGFLLITFIFTILGVFIVPFLYPFIESIQKNKTPFFWWFLNDTKPYDKNDRDWGVYGRFKQNHWGFVKQCAFRNSHWNLKLKLKPIQGEATDIKGEMKLLSVDWNYIKGKTFATYKIKGKKYFRMSMIKEIGKVYFHYQFGATTNRYLFKIKSGII